MKALLSLLENKVEFQDDLETCRVKFNMKACKAGRIHCTNTEYGLTPQAVANQKRRWGYSESQIGAESTMS